MKLFTALILQLVLTGSFLFSQPLEDLPENYSSAFTEESLLNYLNYKEDKNTLQGTAVISFKLEQECFVKLSILDRSGELYEVLIDEYMYPGSYSVHFKPAESRLPEEFEYKLEESGKIYANSFLIKK